MHSPSKMPRLRSGHAPGDLRDTFCEAIDLLEEWEPENGEPMVDLRGQTVPLTKVCGLLWNCTDIMPDEAVTDLHVWYESLVGEPYQAKRRTYAVGARMMKAIIKDQLAA